MNIKQAEEVFEKYHGHSFFSAKVNQVNKVEALYVPFWAASGSVRSKIINAQVGWDRLVTRYNTITKQNESSWETTWRSVQTRHEFTHTYPSTIRELQVYASYKYRRGFLNQIRSSSSILSAKTLEPQDMESTDPEDKRRGLRNRGLDPFTMKPSIALKFVKTAIEDNEVQRAEEWLVDNYSCDRARIMSMDFQYSELVAAPVYVPVYVFSIQYLNRTFRTFVQAHDAAGLVGGMRFYSWQRVSAATAICAIAGLAIAGTSRFGLDMTTGFWLGVVTPSLLVAWSVMYYPIIDYRIRDWWRQREMAGHASEAYSAAWDTNWTKAYDRFEEEQRRQDWNENQEYQKQSSYGSRASSSSSSSTGPPGDPLGYYATLGVSRDASVQEIQSAFRGLAMKWHPDRFSTPKEKEVGKKKFQEITAAYSVLRNEDSDEALSSGGEDVSMPTFRLASPQIRDNIPPSTLSSVSTITSASPSPSRTTSSSPVATTSTKYTSLKQETVANISDGSISSSASPEPTGDIRTFKDPAYVPELPMEDARSLAIAIEDQEMLSRSDLEESMLKNLFAPVKFLESENISILHASTDKHLPWTAQNQEHAIASMRFVPQTRVFYISKQYRTVFLLDVSSSVLTVDSGGSKIVMGQVMETVTKCLSGLAERFSFPGTKQDFVHSEIHVTIIADCSQFASNLHTGEMLANFPTMKVLLQDIILTETNLQSVLRVLKIQLGKFQQRLSQFRSELRRTREKMGYILAVEDAMDDVTTELDLEDDISQRKSWGVGLSGANLSYTLTAGLFALGMMPNSASPSLVIITDGVVKSNLLHGSTVLRRLMELDVSCSIIQLGSRDGVTPNSNWGFVQDTEALRFVTEATLGKFMFSQDCTWSDSRTKAQNLNQQRIAPNIYHRAFLIRELCLLKPRPGLEDIEEKDESPGYSLANFPWDPKSLPEPIKMMQTACKDYHLNIPVEMLIGARIRQGFRIKGVSIAPDRERQGSERYMITMTLAWLPNVTVQYKLKGQISGKGPNYFSRFESPKVEIDIIAYQAFAIHFLNSQHAPVNANHSVYAKVFRIHRYIVGLSDSDVTLRSLNNSHSSANQAVWTLKTKSRERQRKTGNAGLMSINPDDIAAYISRLSEQWSGLAKDADYQYSRGWYNEYEFDALLLTPPPAFLPTAMDTKNSLVKYCEGLETAVQGIRDYLNDAWASFTVGDVFIRTCQAPESNAAATPSTRFCELRLFSEPNVAILRIQLRFFGLELLQRRAISKDLREKIFNFKASRPDQGTTSKTESEVVQVKIVRCQRPIYKLLMRHLICEPSRSDAPESTLTDFHTHVSEPIGEESLLRSYMVHRHWGWKDQVRDTAYLLENNYMATQDLGFQYLCAQRLGEGFLLASALPDRVAFYKEIKLPRQEGTLLRGTSTVQYLIFRSQVSGELVTELWMEPTTDACRHTQFDKIKSEIIAVDRFVLSRLATYEAIHTIGRLRLRPEVSPNLEGGFMYPWIFDPATLLRQQRLVTLAYEAPRRSLTLTNDGDATTEPLRRCIHTFGLRVAHAAEGTSSTLVTAANTARDLLLTRNANTSTTSLNQSVLETEATPLNENDLVVDYKDQLRELCCTDRDLAILHLFMEKSLFQMADGEIMAGEEDDACSQFFLDIKTSIKQNSEVRQALMTFHCANSFQDIRCFVKSVNAKFFRLIIVPKLGSVISHLTKVSSLSSREMDLTRRNFLGCLMFECLRSKPLTDVSEYNVSALDQSQALFELHPVSLGPVISQQPLLIQPVVNEDQGKARVQESTLQLIHSISQAYSHSFAKAIYASLIEGHTIESADLKKACQICTRTTVDINITGFLNTLEQGRRGGTIRQAYLT
ncbi:hypothetical protein BG011_006019 [Mortierella polycephala]|uniref:J domain-containing protein n=1 Tax=Mortierella polycephala TaxID=41804 RepID=A0A9P6PVX3_9FUNG|nr:hypothetical protein BG011_006019 [Mortierella polycephala]